MALTLHGTVSDNTAVLSRPNALPLIINGDMNITQRATSKTGITGTTLEVQDRFACVMGGAGTWTNTSDTDVPAGQGFVKSNKWDCTATGSMEAGSVLAIRYIFEAQDLQLLKYGHANAEKVTLAFWLKSPVTGTHIASLYQFDDNRQVSKAYTVSSANTWQKVVIDFPADTTGVIDNNNGAGMGIELAFRAGTNYSSGTLATSWASYTAANQYVGQVDACASTSNNIYVTGVQLEVGEYTSASIPSFQYESFGDSLRRCQRYFQRYLQPALKGVANGANTCARASMPLIATMRTAPSAAQANGNFVWFNQNSVQPQSSGFSAVYLDENTVEVDVTMTSGGMAVPSPCNVYQGGNAHLSLSAEI
jgi:hypothetical protein